MERKQKSRQDRSISSSDGAEISDLVEGVSSEAVGGASVRSLTDTSSQNSSLFSGALEDFQPVLREKAFDPNDIGETGESFNAAPNDFLPIALHYFHSVEKLSYDLYVRIGTSRFIRVARKDQCLDHERLKRYRDQGVDQFHLQRSAFTDFVEQNLNVQFMRPLGAMSEPDPSAIVTVAENVMAEIMFLNIDQNVLSHTMAVTHEMVEFVEKDQELFKLFNSLTEIGDDFARHGVGVGVLATVLAHELGWTGYSTLTNLSLAGLLHDVGFKELPKGLWSKPRAELTENEVELYESHPERSRKILYGLRSVPAQVITFVAEHHESPDGRGFPRGLKGDQIVPASKLIHFCDLISMEVLKSPLNPTGELTEEAVHRLETIHRHDFPKEYWTAFFKLLKPANQYHA